MKTVKASPSEGSTLIHQPLLFFVSNSLLDGGAGSGEEGMGANGYESQQFFGGSQRRDPAEKLGRDGGLGDFVEELRGDLFEKRRQTL
jgi:hypothetical protein